MAYSRVDVAILGGGLLGWSTGYRLAKAGQRVLVIDALEPGTATNAGAGIIASGTGHNLNETAIDLFKRSIEYYNSTLIAELASDGETNTGYQIAGSILLARSDDEADQLAARRDLMVSRRDDGLGNVGHVEIITGAEAKERHPAVSDVPAALYASGAGRVNGRLLRDSLHAAAEKYGAKLAIGRGRIVTDGARAAGVLVNGELIPAGQVLICGGAWSVALGEQLGVFLDMFPQRGQILHIDLIGQETSGWPILTSFNSFYILAFPNGRMVLGGTRESDSGFDPTFTASGMQVVLNETLSMAAGLSTGNLAEWRVGLRPFSRDEKPILGEVPGWENIFVATGHGASGLQLGPVSGAAVAELMLGQTPHFDLAPYSAARFS